MDENTELEALESELAELEKEEFDLADFDDGELEELGELGVEIEEAGFETFGAEEVQSFESLTAEGDEQQVDMAFLDSFLKRRARRLLKKLIGLVRRHRRLRRCRRCMQLLLKTLRFARAGRWIAALRYGVRTFRCFRRCLRG